MEIITKQFGIEPTLLLAQIVNFLIILFVLKKFFYKPIVKMLDERRTTIGESLKNAEEIEAKLKSTEEKTASILKSAQDQSQKIIESAQDQATKIAENAQIEAKKSTEQTIADAIEQIQQEKAQMKKDLESEVLTLVTTVTQKVLGRKLKGKEREELTQDAVSEITHQSS